MRRRPTLCVLFFLIITFSDACKRQPASNTRRPASVVTLQTVNGRVVRIADGDTITILDATNTQHRIRLQGIDAPESHQAFGAQSKQNLSALVFDKDVTATCDKTDQYG